MDLKAVYAALSETEKWDAQHIHDSAYCGDHGRYASYSDDVALGIAWGSTQDVSRLNFKFLEEISLLRDDPKLMYVDILYQGSLVKRTSLIVADGGRCYLPIPGVSNLRECGEEPDFFFPIRAVLVAQLLSGLDQREPFYRTIQLINHVRKVLNLRPIDIDYERRGWD